MFPSLFSSSFLTLVLPLFGNIVFSVIAGTLAKLWAENGPYSGSLWTLSTSVLSCCLGFLCLTLVIKNFGLGSGTALALVINILINILIALIFFKEEYSLLQYIGILLAVISIACISFGKQ